MQKEGISGNGTPLSFARIGSVARLVMPLYWALDETSRPNIALALLARIRTTMSDVAHAGHIDDSILSRLRTNLVARASAPMAVVATNVTNPSTDHAKPSSPRGEIRKKFLPAESGAGNWLLQLFGSRLKSKTAMRQTAAITAIRASIDMQKCVTRLVAASKNGWLPGAKSSRRLCRRKSATTETVKTSGKQTRNTGKYSFIRNYQKVGMPNPVGELRKRFSEEDQNANEIGSC